MRAAGAGARSGAEPRTAKIAFPAGKTAWHPSVLPGPIVLVSTMDAAGEPNIAPKSWVSMMAFRGPVLAFGCHRSHATARNAETSGEFVECRAHLECTLKSVTRLGAEVVVFGTIVAASIDEDCAAPCLADQYFRLRPVFFLEEGVYGSIDTAKRIGAARPAEQSLTVVELYDPPAIRMRKRTRPSCARSGTRESC